MTTPAHSHTWKFFRAGGFDQVRLDATADLLHLEQLDQKLWVALSCPVKGLEFDEKTLTLIDTDGDGHVRAPELIAALHWAGAHLTATHRELLARGAARLPLAAISSEGDSAPLAAAARRILAVLGKADQDDIGLEETQGHTQLVASAPLNGDGVVTAASTDDEALKAVIAEVIGTVGSETDLSGEPGVSAALLERFVSEANAWLAWQDSAAADPAVLPLGEATATAWDAYAAVRVKIDDWFARVRLAAYDDNAATALNPSSDDFRLLSATALSASAEGVAALPLAKVAPPSGDEPVLALNHGLNPAWSERLAAFVAQVVAPLLGARSSLSASDWQAIQAKLAPYAAWRANAVDTPVAALGRERLVTLRDSGQLTRLAELIAADAALAPEFAAFADVDRLVRYVRDLATLAHNFVSFRDFYTAVGNERAAEVRNGNGNGNGTGIQLGKQLRAVFQAGTLFLDGRSCDLCVKVDNADKHATGATLSRLCLVYCECVRNGEKMTIAAAFTSGDSDQLMVGRNGVFYDRKGRDWDAVVVKILDHPISLRQAFWQPYRKAAKAVSDAAQKFAATRAQARESQMTAAAVANTTKTLEGNAPPAPPPPPAFDAAKFAGIFAAIGLAIGAVGTAIATVVTGFLGLRWWQMPLALGGIVLLISGPAVLLAWFKLRSRTLGPILDANGWAVNARAKINIPFGTSLTQLAKLPEGAERSLTDPYAEKKRPWGFYLFLLIVAGGLLFWVARSLSGS